MALRSGYYGLKNATKKILEKLAVDTAGMKIIKSFGDGLSLSNAGKLSVTAGTANKIGGFKVGSGLTVVDGVLSTLGGLDYSSTEQNTGVNWLDGKDIYVNTFTWETAVTGLANVWLTTPAIIDFVADIIGGQAYANIGSGARVYPATFGKATETSALQFMHFRDDASANYVQFNGVTLYYTKQS